MRSSHGFPEIVGDSPAMQDLQRMIRKVALRAPPALIVGESGTGKELVARAIHLSGKNGSGPFVAIDCGALTPTLIESELFGHAQGAFTGAHRAKEGLLKAADGGTAFFDEIGELPFELQAKLLRTLQEKEVRPVGATKSTRISVRIVAATHRNLKAEVDKGRFREDLYYRFAVVVLRVPPLRERSEDIPQLARYFVEKFSPPEFDSRILPEAMKCLERFQWPGNVRELENAIERAVALSTDGPIRKEDLPTAVQNLERRPLAVIGDEVVPMAELEKRAIHHALTQAKNNRLQAARLLGISKTTLYRKLKEYRD